MRVIRVSVPVNEDKVCMAFGVPPWAAGFGEKPGRAGRTWWHVRAWWYRTKNQRLL